MTVQTTVGPVTLDSGDFKHTYSGVTWGVKVRYIPVMDGSYSLDVVIAELVSGTWVYKALAAQDDEQALKTMGLSTFLSTKILPAVNAWLQSRFTGLQPDPTIPSYVAALDAVLFGMKVSIVDGKPVVSV